MSLLDLHILTVLQHEEDGIPAYLNSAAAFAELFPRVGAATVEKWRAELAAPPEEAPELEPVVYKRSWSAGIPEHARVIMVKPPSEREVQGYIHDRMGAISDEDGERPLVGSTVDLSVEILVMTLRDYLTDALRVLVRAVLLRAREKFLSVDYHSLLYQGSSNLEPYEQLFAEDLGVFIHRLNYSSRFDVTIPLLLPGQRFDHKPFEIQLEQVEPDPDRDPAPGAGTPGGVTPSL